MALERTATMKEVDASPPFNIWYSQLGIGSHKA